MYSFGIEAHRIVAYTYDAAVHCTMHAEAAFGLGEDNRWVREDAIDSEGNPVHPVFSVDQDIRTIEACDDDITEIVCLTCGMVYDRKFGDPCWNCATAWVTDYE